MKIVRMEKTIGFLMIIVAGFTSCSKQDPINERINLDNDPAVTIRPTFPPVPKIPLPLTRCIHSYQDILDVLGNNSNNVSGVVLANGNTLFPGGDLNAIVYAAIPSTQSNSLFDSKLSAEWRWPGGNWQLSTADVWSLGCVYEQAGQPPYTNLIKGGDTILINTCFYWSTNEYTGERINFLIIQ